MLKITDKDRVFAAIAVPAALVALYAYFIHRPIARRVHSMETRLYDSVDADFQRDEQVHLERRREEARKRLQKAEADEKAKTAAAATNANAAATAPGDASARLRNVVALLGDADGVRISSTTLVAAGPSASPAAPLVKEALGGESPNLWRFDVIADYGSILGALRLISGRNLPAVVEAVSLDGAKRGADAGRAAGAAARSWRIDVVL